MPSGREWFCKCGATKVEPVNSTTLNVTGKGWMKGQQKTEIACHLCGDSKRIGFNILWDGEDPNTGTGRIKVKKRGKKPARKSTRKTDSFVFVE